MPRLYLVEFEAQTIAAASGDIDLFSLDAATDKPIELVEVCLGQTTELGDTAEEQLRIRYIRGHTTVGSGGASATPRPASANDAAAKLIAADCSSWVLTGQVVTREGVDMKNPLASVTAYIQVGPTGAIRVFRADGVYNCWNGTAWSGSGC